jgi:hypothetical protein
MMSLLNGSSNHFELAFYKYAAPPVLGAFCLQNLPPSQGFFPAKFSGPSGLNAAPPPSASRPERGLSQTAARG